MDAAIALSSPDELSCSTPSDDGYGAPGTEIHSAYGDPGIIGDEDLSQLLGSSVKKYGRTTGLTSGTINTINASVNVCYDRDCNDVARFTDQIIITPGTFSGGGDSGSLVVTDDDSNTPVALLFAGSNVNTIANRIDLVLNRFGVSVDSCETTTLSDIAMTSVDAPLSAVESDTVTTHVTVRNTGTEDVSGAIPVTLVSDNATPGNHVDDITIGTQTIAGGLAAGENILLSFDWDTTGTNPGDHVLTAAHEFADDDVLSNNSAEAVMTILSPLMDVAVLEVSAPASVEKGQTVAVSVTVQNVGNQDAGSFTLTLNDLTDSTDTPQSQDVQVLEAGASAVLSFSWETTDASLGDHTLEAGHSLQDYNGLNDSLTTTVSMVEAAAGPLLETGEVTASTSGWTTVTLSHEYGNDMVVVCSPNYDRNITSPTVVHVQNASGSSFQVRLAPAVFYTFEDWSATVQWMVVKAGVYNVDEHGVKMETGKFTSSTTAGRRNWVANAITYQNSYANPVVLGQVMSYNSELWSVFWSRGASATTPPSSTVCQVGKHIGEDLDPRSAETIGYVILERGSGTIDNRPYAAAVGADSIRGMGNSPPYTYGLNLGFTPSTAIVSQAGMDGGDGGWAVLYGENFVTATGLRLAIEEDWYWDSERSHTTEQVAYVVVGNPQP